MATKSIDGQRREKVLKVMEGLTVGLEKLRESERSQENLAAVNESVSSEEETAGSIINGVMTNLYQARAIADVIVCDSDGQLDGLRPDTVGALGYALLDVIEESINKLDCRTIFALPMRQGGAA